MDNDYRKLKPGDFIPGLPAKAWNDMLDVVAAYKAGKLTNAVGGIAVGGGATGIVPVKNTTASNRARFEILTVTGIVFTPTANLNGFKNQPVLTCGATGTPPEKFVILQEPIKAGKIGRAMLCGMTPVQIDVVDATDEFADVISADSTKLRSKPFGAARILYKESSTGTKWAYVEVGHVGYPMLIGKANAAIAKSASGTINIYVGTTKGSEAFTGSYTVSAYARMGDIASGKWVYCVYVQGGWEVFNAECP